MASKKRSDFDGAEEERRTRRRVKKKEEEVTDDQVDEFFAILQRMREATRFFTAGGSGDEAKGQEVRRWRLAFEREDFKAAAPVEDTERRRRKRKRGADAAAESGEERERSREVAAAEVSISGIFDLNAEPAREQ
ncbi:hypothetical protein MUK42_27267 [Musa troglodytarum]|uniref:Uncharacterized protein n=1 Tax=Musa troglodytarum TaxID=320322 RepID=A0A9E7JPB0_9LILI|nr:hypothetical protein MUK42_27267 [Musa troglodytarum]